jgi:hypothetical protein
MPYIGNRAADAGAYPPEILNGIGFAHGAVDFAALALVSGRLGCLKPQMHLFAVATELAFKSLALRAGATLEECKNASHKITKMISLIEKHGVEVPSDIKTHLADDKWFKKFLLLTRYTELKPPTSRDKTIALHRNYPEMIAQILEIPSNCPLEFERGGALSEINERFLPSSVTHRNDGSE